MTAQEIQLNWNKDFYVAKELAQSESKPILVYFYKSDCKTCQNFYTELSKSDAFKTVADDFVLVMLDGSKTDINNQDINLMKMRRLVMHYNKEQQFPALRALDANAQELGDLFTSLNSDDLSAYIDYLQTIK